MTTKPLTHLFYSVQSPAGIGDDPQISHAIGSLDSQGNLLPGSMYSDRLKSGVLSLSRVQPNTFKLRFLRTQVAVWTYWNMTPNELYYYYKFIISPSHSHSLCRRSTWACMCALCPLGVLTARVTRWRSPSTRARRRPYDGLPNVRKLHLSALFSSSALLWSLQLGSAWCHSMNPEKRTLFCDFGSGLRLFPSPQRFTN